MKRLFLVVAVLLALVAPSLSQANLITNGDFSSGPTPTGPYTTLAAGSNAIPYWTIGGAGIDYITGLWQAPPGTTRSLDMSALDAGFVSTTFNTSSGQQYSITFALAGNVTGDTKHLEVTVGAYNNIFTFDTAGLSYSNMGWVDQSFTVTGNGAPMTLTFTSLDGSSAGPALGNVRVDAVPLPASLLLFAPGLLGLVGMRKRLKK